MEYKLSLCVLLVAFTLSAGAPSPIGTNIKDAMCKACRWIIGDAHESVSNKANKAYLEDKLLTRCDDHEDKELCHSIVNGFGPELFDLLSHHMNPNEICNNVHLCDEEKETVIESPEGVYPPEEEREETRAEVYPAEEEEEEAHEYHPEEEPEPVAEPEEREPESVAEPEEREEEPEPEETHAAEEVMYEGGVECEMGRFIIETLNSIIVEDMTSDVIRKELSKLCHDLPEEIGRMCLKYEDDILAAMQQFGPDAEKISEKIGLCRKYGVVYSDLENIKTPIECETCKQLIKKLDEVVHENATIAEIKAALTKICNDLGTGILGQKCKEFEPKIIAAVKKFGLDPEKACEAIGVCTGKKPEQVKSDVRKQYKKMIKLGKQALQGYKGLADPVECELCKELITMLDELIEENATIAEINATMIKFCDDLGTGVIGQRCKDFIPKALEAIEEFGLDDPVKVCEAMGVCPGKMEIPEETYISMKKQMKRLKEQTPKDQDVEDTDNKKEPEDSVECEICKFMVTAVDIILKENHTEAAINHTLSEVCSVLPSEFKQICQYYQPTVLKLIMAGFTPDVACKEAGMCKGMSGERKLPVMDCDACYIAAEKIAPVDKLEEVFHNLCSPLCSRKKRSVESPVKEIEKEIIEKVKDEGSCELCKFLAEELEKLLDEDKDEEAVSHSVDKICDNLPHEYKSRCEKMGPEILAEALSGVSFMDVCKETVLCGQRTPVKEVIEHKVEAIEEHVQHRPDSYEHRLTDEAKCMVCKDAVRTLDEELLNNEAKVVAFIDNICNAMPQPARNECRKVVDDNFAKIFQKIITTYLNPETVCQQLKLCDKQIKAQAEEQEPVEEVQEHEEVEEPHNVEYREAEQYDEEGDKEELSNETSRSE